MSRHSASIPAPARAYFEGVGIQNIDRCVYVSGYFKPEKGWRRHPLFKRVSIAELRRLRSLGCTHVALTCWGRTADFTISELLSTRKAVAR